MNRFIAQIFAGILSLVHLVVIIGLGLVTLAAFSEDKRSLSSIGHAFGFGFDDRYILFIVFLCWVGYVLLMGIISTFISINENLERLNAKLEELPGKMRGE